jgi:hypothetical protein
MDVFNEVIDYESKNIKKLYKEGKVTQFLKNKLKLLVQSLDHVVLNDTNIHK